MKEEAFYYGESNRGFGMVTLPEDTDGAPVAVLFNAGLVHREGPYRLNVLIARALASVGIISIRVDLSGKGDTPAREGLINRKSVSLDWSFIKKNINDRFGQRSFLLIGLCSGADNSIKLTVEEENVRGLVLMDPISPQDKDFNRRLLISKLKNPYKWLNLPYAMATRFRRATGLEQDPLVEATMLRDEPTREDLDCCMRHIVECNGRVLAVFTSQASYHYNIHGQFTRALAIKGFENCCEELHWPLANHIYQVEIHRERLINKILSWAADNFEFFRLSQQ